MPGNEHLRFFVILIRHASREVHWDMPEEKQPMQNWTRWITATIEGKSDFKTEGFPRTYALAGRLCDELENNKICVAALRYSKHKVAQQTAEVYKKVMNRREKFESEVKATPYRALAPKPSSPNAEVRTQIKNVIRDIERIKAHQSNRYQVGFGTARQAYVVVGHQPQLTQIARRLLKDKYLPIGLLPLGNSEAACIELGDKPRLQWLLTVTPEETLLTDLKDKIKSKYDVAKFLLGAFVVNTGLILNAGLWGSPEKWNGAPIAKWVAYFAILAALISLVFTAATLFSYDSLLMPSKFWSESSELDDEPRSRLKRFLRELPPKWSVSTWSVSRPPSSAHVILFYEMVHVWNVFFMPAVFFAFVAIGCLTLALVCRGESCLPSVGWWLFVILALVGGLALLKYYWEKEPRLGSED
jgi:hypothetical protein